MALVPIAFSVETAQDLEDRLNVLLAPLLDIRITGVVIDQIQQIPFFKQNLSVSLTYETGAPVTLFPFQFRQFSSSTEAQAIIRVEEFIAANPGYFFSPIFSVYRPQSPDPLQGVIIGIFYSEDPAASANWGPSSASANYINPNPTPAAVGGIAAGSTFPVPGQTMQQMWDALLYPYQAPSFSSFAITGQTTPKEVGATIPASVTFTWTASNPANIQPNSIDILDITGATTLASGLANDGSEPVVMGAPITLVVAGSYQFRITGVNTNAVSFLRNLTFEWRWRLFFGVSANPTLTGPQIGALAGSALVTSYPGTYACGAGGYKYIAQADAAGGQLNTVKDQSTNLDVPMATVADDPAYSNVDGGGYSYALVSYTNVNGVTTNYRVYRTANSLGGAVTLLVT